MKHIILFTTLLVGLMLTVNTTQAQSKKADRAAIEKTLHAFNKAGNTPDPEALENLLHDQFRVVLNRAFGGNDVSIMDKQTYIGMIRDGKIGGVERSLKIEDIDVMDHMASVKAVMENDKLVFHTRWLLVKNPENQWVLVSDAPLVTPKN